MKKIELVKAVAEAAGLSQKEAENAIQAFAGVVKEELANGGSVTIKDFGTFQTVVRKARKSHDFVNGGIMTVPAKTVAKFKPSKNILNV